MDLTDFGRALRRYWPLSLLVGVIVIALGLVFGLSGGPSYSSTATLAVTPNPARTGTNDQIEFEIPRIVERVGASPLHDALPPEVMAEVTSLSAERSLDGGIVRVTAEGTSAQAVATAANGAAAIVVEDYQPTDNRLLTPAGRGDLVQVEVVDTAYADTGTGRDTLVPIMLATTVLALILAGAAVAVAQMFSRARDLESRIRTEIGIPVLAVVPAVRELGTGEVSVLELLRTGSIPLIEAFHVLRSRSEILLPDAKPAVVVSSWGRREGRTTIATGLGVMLAAVGQHSVVVDGSLRKPDLSARLAAPGARGLAEYVAHDGGALVQHTDQPLLDIVPAGIAHAHPAEIISVGLPRALDLVWRGNPSARVIIDAPPLGPALRGAVQRPAETAALLGIVPQLLIVVDASTKNMVELSEAVARLQEDGVRVLGAVVNRRRGRRRWRRAEPAAKASPLPAPAVAIPETVRRARVPAAPRHRPPDRSVEVGDAGGRADTNTPAG